MFRVCIALAIWAAIDISSVSTEHQVPAQAIACPNCGKRYKLDIAGIGRQMKCRKCQQKFEITAPDDELDFESADFEIEDDEEEFGPELPEIPLPTRKKKKPTVDTTEQERRPKKNQPESKRVNPLVPLLIGGVMVAGVVGLLFLPINLLPAETRIQAPEGYDPYEDKIGKHFHIEAPRGWVVEAGGRGSSNPWVRFINGKATIRLKTSVGASAIGDVMKAGGAGARDVPDSMKPAAQIHTMMKEQFAQDFSNYEEKPPRTVDTGMGDGRLSEFTAAGSWGSKLRGIRLTCLGVNYQFTVICNCPEADWAVCQPVFEHVALSLSP